MTKSQFITFTPELLGRLNNNSSCSLKSLLLVVGLCVSQFFGPHFAIAQTTIKNYDIKIAGVKVGQFTATATKDPLGCITYCVNSNVDVNILVYKMNTKFVSKTKYQNGQIVHARVDMTSNKGDFYTETKKLKSGYEIKGEHQSGAFEKAINESITMSVGRMYFEEPTKETKVYAEFYGGFMKIKKMENGVYHGKIDNNEDFFYFKDGILIKTIKKNGFKDLEFIYVNTITHPSK